MKNFLNYCFNLSISTEAFADKNSIKWCNVKYKRNDDLNIFEFIKLVNEGHTFCYCFNDEGKIFGQQVKTEKNFHHTTVLVLDVDDCKLSMDEYVGMIPEAFKPTLSYTTQNDSKENHRFRLVYCLNFTIFSINLYKNLYFKIISILEASTKIEMKDNCMKSVSQQFAGNASGNHQYILRNISYDLDDFKTIVISDKFSKIINQKRNKENTNTLNEKTEISDEMLNDFNELSHDDFIEKYSKKYNYQMETPYSYDSDGIARLYDREYYRIYHKFDVNDGHLIRYTVGDDRRTKMMLMALTMYKINPRITDENIFYNLVVELTYFFNNSDNKINLGWMISTIKEVRKMNEEGYNNIQSENRNFIINKEYFAKDIAELMRQGKTHKGAVMSIVAKVRKKINNERIGEVYDLSKSVKENLKIMHQKGLKVSQATLYRFVKNNGL